MPKPHDIPMQLSIFCDTTHATNLVTRRSITGIIIFLMGMLILLCYSKQQYTIEFFKLMFFVSYFVAL